MNNTFNFITSPLDQFEIRDLISLDVPLVANAHISITNIGFYLVIGFFITLNVNILANNYNKLISNNWSISMETIYATVHSIVVNQINEKKRTNVFSFYICIIYVHINK